MIAKGEQMRIVAVIEFEFDFTSELEDVVDIVESGEYFPDNVVNCTVYDVSNSIDLRICV